MFGIATAHLARDRRPAAAPETRQVARRLDRPAGRRGQRQHQWLARTDHRMGVDAEQSLDADNDGRAGLGLIVDGVAAASRRLEMAGCEPVQSLATVPAEPPFERTE